MGNSASLEYWNWPWAPADEVRCSFTLATQVDFTFSICLRILVKLLVVSALLLYVPVQYMRHLSFGRSKPGQPSAQQHASFFELYQALLLLNAVMRDVTYALQYSVFFKAVKLIISCLILQILIEAIENVGRCQRSDHIKKAINYVKILLEKQAEPNARDEWGSGSALHYAIWCGQLEVVKLLLDTGSCNIEADTGAVQSSYTYSAALFQILLGHTSHLCNLCI